MEPLPGYEKFHPAFETIKNEALKLSDELKDISWKIHDHPELAYKEFYAHKLLTDYLTGLKLSDVTVKPSFILPTAFKATFEYSPASISKKSPFNFISSNKATTEPASKPICIGICAEYDSLPQIGHACGHNLIASSALFVFLTLRAAMLKHKIAGKVVLLGCPAEEGGGGKIPLIAAGAFKDVDCCVMTHPGPGPEDSSDNWGSVRPSLAIQTINVEYTGKTSHAASAPWNGINSLDASMIAYSSISALRQQTPTTDRIHGVVTNGGLAPNIIPEKSSLKYFIRSPAASSLVTLRTKIDGCFNGAALATGCQISLKAAPAHMDQRNNAVLAVEYQKVMGKLFGQEIVIVDSSGGGAGGGAFSTDFGNVTYEVPCLGANYAIPTVKGGGNHTALFHKAARTDEAHMASLKSAVGLACTSVTFLTDRTFAAGVKKSWEDEMKENDAATVHPLLMGDE